MSQYQPQFQRAPYGQQQQQQQQGQQGQGGFRYQKRKPFTPGDLESARKVRKAIQRRTIDFNALVLRELHMRPWLRRPMTDVAVQPDPNFVFNLMPPYSYVDYPMTSIPKKFAHSSINKIRCPIYAVKWTPEGRRLITGAATGEFTLWNGLTFNFETILQAHDRGVRSMTWTNNGNYMVTGDDGGVIKYWQPNLNNIKVMQAHKENVRDISFSPTDAKFASCSDDGTIKIWSFADAREEKVLTGHGWDVKCIHWHPSKGILASGAKDNLVKVWDPKSGKPLATLHGHRNTILGVQWNKNGNWLLTGSRDQLVRVYDIRTMKEMQSFKALAWHPVHETLFASGGYEGALYYWLVGKDQPVESNDTAHESGIFTLDWHPMGHILVSGSNDHATRFWTRNRPGERSEDIMGTFKDSEVAEEGKYFFFVTLRRGISNYVGCAEKETDVQQLPGLGSRAKTQQSNGITGHIPGFKEPTPTPSLYSQRGRSAAGSHSNESLNARTIPGIQPTTAPQPQQTEKTNGSLPTPVLPQSFMKPSVSMMPPPLPGLGSANRPPMMPPIPPLPPVPSASKMSKNT